MGANRACWTPSTSAWRRASGITVLPRGRRHITRRDVLDIAEHLKGVRPRVELNMEADPRPDFIELVHAVRPEQCTLVPVVPGEITSQAGWTRVAGAQQLPEVIAGMKAAGIRVSFFDIRVGRHRAGAAGRCRSRRLYTRHAVRPYCEGAEAAVTSFEEYSVAATLAHEAGLA
ncbi:MAG: pyridoxine 5'-phosphate synthase [Vicinamibacterales bacterium]